MNDQAETIELLDNLDNSEVSQQVENDESQDIKKQVNSSKYITLVQVLICIFILLVFFLLKELLPDIYSIMNGWYTETLSKEIPVTYFGDLMNVIFGG